MNDTSVNASRIHSTGDLSALWLLRRPDGITRRQDVEKAIRLGLPLWPDAVRMARLHHRSNDDLAGGMFYYVSKDFVDDKGDGDNFMYHEYVNYREQQMENYSRTCGDISSLSLSQTSGNKSFRHNIPNAIDAASDLRPYTLLTSLATIPNFNSVQVPPANYIATNMIPVIMSLSNNSFTTMGSRPHVLEASVNSTDILITSCYEEFSHKATLPILVEYPTDIISPNTFTASFVHAESLSGIPEDIPIIPFARSLERFVAHSESETDVFKPPDIDLRYMLQKDREHEIRLFLNIVRTMKEENTCHMEDAGIENNSDAITHINDKITVATSIRCGTRSVKTSSSVCVMSSCHPKSFELERISRSDLSSLSQSHSSFFNDISDLFPSYITQIPNEIWSRNEGSKMNKISHCFSILNETVDFPIWRIFQKPRIKERIITQIKQLSGVGTSRNDYLESRDSIVPLLSEFSSVHTTLFDESNYDREAKSVTCRCDDCIKQLLNEKNYYPSSGSPVMHFGPNKNYFEFSTKPLLMRNGDSISASLQKALTHVMNMPLDFKSNRDFTVEHPLPIEMCNSQHFLSVPLLNNKFEDACIEKPDVCSEELCSLNVIDGDSTFIDPDDVNGDVDDMDDIGEFIFAEISELRMAEGASPTGSHCTDESEKSLEVGVVLFFTSSEEACGDSALLGLDTVERAAMTCPAGRMLPVISLESISESTLQIVEIIVEFSSNSYNVEVGKIFPERIFDQMSLSIEH
uniref:ANK_REP_REGION domain-containing protein n=1 Tax=Heterorhabditis bacteriophora TaxID=37862 RepID=A0A1I7WTX7_HETBA